MGPKDTEKRGYGRLLVEGRSRYVETPARDVTCTAASSPRGAVVGGILNVYAIIQVPPFALAGFFQPFSL